MIDFTQIEKYKENNRIEAKKAIGGLPHSIWETYSAFANTLGGVILLGVKEHADKTLHAVDLPDPEMLVAEFWDIISNTNKVSVNILCENDVTIEQIDGKRIVAIRIPHAQRSDKPVHVDGNPFAGSYRRNGEGDYRCTQAEVRAMMRDAAIRTQDMDVLDGIGTDVFDYKAVKRYRACLKTNRHEHAWNELTDEEFLLKIGAVGIGKDGEMHPTAAGLLMFGYAREIVSIYPDFYLEYTERLDGESESTYSIVSSSGEWSGNIFDFYSRVYERITHGIKDNYEVGKRNCARVVEALREALANSLINADYYGRLGVVVTKQKDVITFSNPGRFRIQLQAAKIGGVSDPRNSLLTKMFNLIDVGDGSGSGIPNIFSVWKKQGWHAPELCEYFDPDRITLSLPISKGEKKDTQASGDKKAARAYAHKGAIISYLTENVIANSTEIAQLLGVKEDRAKEILADMVKDGYIVASGSNDDGMYKLKA
ncbi:MAG: AAA family ATPase [Clostridiales bacterium]|nr:AAA family ATPase [Clostridiales bacterium]